MIKVGLSLSGGAAKGLVHLGVLQELEKAEIPIDMISGCSIGAILGAMYAVDPDVNSVIRKVSDFLRKNEDQIIPINYVVNEEREERRSLLNKIADSLKMSMFYGISLAKLSYLTSDKLKESLGKLIPDIDIRDLETPFAVSATDLTNYSDYYFTEGSLLDAVVASCSLPGLYPPVHHNGAILIDGGWAAPNMVDKLREMGADMVIASNIIPDISAAEVNSGLDVVIRSDAVSRKVLSDLQLRSADVVIQPTTCQIHWWDFNVAEECFQLGVKEAAAKIPEIKRKMRRIKLRKFFRVGV